MAKGRTNDARCPCGSSRAEADCCAPVLAGAEATTAEALMRARYTAHVHGDADFLHASWHPDTRPERVGLDDGPRWIGLRVHATAAGGAADDVGTVEFVARYKVGGRAHRHHELSEFARSGGRWVYVRGRLAGNDDGGETP
jgi:SEC-C motif-containing protein